MAIAVGAVALVLAGVRVRPEPVVDHPRWVLGILGGISLAAVLALVDCAPWRLRIALDPSEEPLMVRNDPARDVYDLATRSFGSDDTFVIAMQTDDVFTARNLAALRRISDRVLKLPGVRRAESLVDIHAYAYDAARDSVDVGRFIREIPDDPAALAELRRRALEDPIYPKLVVSPDGRTAAINLSFRTASDREFIDRGLDEAIRTAAEQEAGPERRFFFTGRPHVKARAYRVMVTDLLRLIPLSVAVASLAVFLMTGSARGALLPLIACLTATLWTFGVLALLDNPVNLITIVLGPTLISLGGLYGVHVFGRYEIEASAAATAREAALRTLRYSWLPVVIAGATTCVGFGALLLADIPAINELGLFSLFGIACLTLISLVGLAAGLALLPLPARRDAASAGTASSDAGPTLNPFGRVLDRLLAGLARLACRRPTAVLVFWGLTATAASAVIPRIVIDTDYLTFFDERSRVRRDFASVRDLLIGPVPLYVTFTSDQEGTFREPANLRTLEHLQARIEELAGVSAAISIVDILPQLNRAMERDDPAAEHIPDQRGAISDLVFLVPKDQMRRFANSNHSAANIVVRTGELGSHAIRDLRRRILAVISDDALSPAIRTDVTGNAVVLNRSADRIAGNQTTTVTFATLTILVLMAAVFRSLGIGALAMIPNVIPVLIFFGVLGMGAAALSLPTSLIGCIVLGVAVDDTVHFLVNYRRQRRAGETPSGAVTRTMQQVGRPMVITSVMLVAGFLTITLSGFATLREFGTLTAIIMAICLSTDLVLLPALLIRARA